jgi:hypothetical protein
MFEESTNDAQPVIAFWQRPDGAMSAAYRQYYRRSAWVLMVLQGVFEVPRFRLPRIAIPDLAKCNVRSNMRITS